MRHISMTAQDPLTEILERHLFKASTEGENSGAVIEAILGDYIKLLYSQGVHIPQAVQKYFTEDLREEIQEMIIKKTHATISCEVLPPSRPSVGGPSRKIS